MRVVGGASRAPPRDSRAREEALLAELVGSGAPLRLALARIAARVVEGRTWEKLGYVRCHDYARERAGVSARELRELARVGARVIELPRLGAAYASGEITWTKLRSLTRCASALDQEEWLATAACTSATKLAREVRDLELAAAAADPRAESDPDANPDARLEMVRVRCGRDVAAAWERVVRVARRASGAHLAVGDAAEAVAAEIVSSLPLEVDPESVPLSDRVRRRLPSRLEPPCLPPPAGSEAPAFVAALVDGVDDASPAELDARLRRATRLERGLLARIGPHLLDLALSRGWADLGFRSFDQYAQERLGMSPSRARALLRIERACGPSLALARVWRGGALTWCQALVLARVVVVPHSLPWHDAWVQRAARVTLRRLEDDLAHAVETDDFDPRTLPVVPEGLQNGAAPAESRISPITPPHPSVVQFVAPVDRKSVV